MFNNPAIQSIFKKFNGESFGNLTGFGMMLSSSDTSFYVVDLGADKVYMLNDNWSFLSFKTFPNPTFMITVENSLYLTGQSNIWKLDLNLNVLIQYTATVTVWYRGLYFNSTNRFLYVAALVSTEIHVFDLNLTLSHSFSTSPYYPYSITGYNYQLYVGTLNGTVLVVQNETIVNQFNGCGGNGVWVLSILFDQYGYCATSCIYNKLYLLFANGTYTGKDITTPTYPVYIGFDSKGHFIQISRFQITIYN